MLILGEMNVNDIRYAKATNHVMRRMKRFNKAKEIGVGSPIAAFYVDNNHPDGHEIHTITDNGLIYISNAESQQLVTVLIARPNQIKRYYKGNPNNLPQAVMEIAQVHKKQKLYRI